MGRERERKGYLRNAIDRPMREIGYFDNIGCNVTCRIGTNARVRKKFQ